MFYFIVIVAILYLGDFKFILLHLMKVLFVSRSLWCFNNKTSQVTTHFELLLLKPFIQALKRLILYNKVQIPAGNMVQLMVTFTLKHIVWQILITDCIFTTVSLSPKSQQQQKKDLTNLIDLWYRHFFWQKENKNACWGLF